MPQDWQYGNAARQPNYEDSKNPFTPVDYAQRLQNSPRTPRQPRQNYVPPVPSAPPMPAQGYQQPAYMQQPAQQGYVQPPVQSAPNNAGAPYSAALFDHQPTAVMPSGFEDVPFADRTAIDFWGAAPAQAPVWHEEEPRPEAQPVYYSVADIPMRDPFTPAKPREDAAEQAGKQPEKADAAAKKQRPAERPPVRVGRLLALIAAGVMFFISLLMGGSMVAELLRTEREAKVHEAGGMDVYNGAALVELPPPGETFAPSEVESSYSPLITPAPSSGEQNDAASGQSAMRTRQTSYPKNPMRNITESLRELYAANPDVAGRLVISGLLDEMVMQRNNTYYLTHNANGVTSDSGAVFADQSCVLRNPPENLLLRGQSGVPGKIFAPLWQFVSGGQSFAASNMYAKLTTLYEDETYVLFAALVVDIDPSGSRYFNYASNPSFTTDAAMMQYVESARSRSIYQFNVDVNAGDRLLTLSTFGSGESNLVLMYRMLRENETPAY